MASSPTDKSTERTISRTDSDTPKQNEFTYTLFDKNEQGSTQTSEPSKDVIFALLKNSRRRQVIQYISNAGRTVTTAELAEHIALIENDIDIAQLNSRQRKRVYVALYQTHLPKLDTEDIIQYDASRGRVTLTKNIESLQKYLDDDHLTSKPKLLPLAVCLISGGLVFLLLGVYEHSVQLRISIFIVFALTGVISVATTDGT